MTWDPPEDETRNATGSDGRRTRSRGAQGGYAPDVAVPARWGTEFVVAHGVVGGVLAGIAMTLAAAIFEGLTGRGFLTFLRLIGGVVYGQSALAGIGPLLVGAALHLVTSAALGVPFAWRFCRARVSLVLWGVLYASTVWLVAEYLALPLLDPAMAEAIHPFSFLAFHLIYGATLGGYLEEGRSA